MTDAPLTIIADDRAFATIAAVEGAKLTEHDIRSHELDRARRALAHLKFKLGDDAIRGIPLRRARAMKPLPSRRNRFRRSLYLRPVVSHRLQWSR